MCRILLIRRRFTINVAYSHLSPCIFRSKYYTIFPKRYEKKDFPRLPTHTRNRGIVAVYSTHYRIDLETTRKEKPIFQTSVGGARAYSRLRMRMKKKKKKSSTQYSVAVGALTTAIQAAIGIDSEFTTAMIRFVGGEEKREPSGFLLRPD